MVEHSINKDEHLDPKKLLTKQQLDAFGTPMVVKTPLDFKKRLEEQKEDTKKAQTKLICATMVSCVFITAELIGGWWAGSIAIFADSAHLASDIVGFGISILALKLA